MKDRMVYQSPGFFVQKLIFAAARGDRKRIVPDQTGDRIGIQAGAVEHHFRPDRSAVRRFDPVTIRIFFSRCLDCRNRKIRQKLRAVIHRVPDGMQRQLIGAYDRAGRRRQGASDPGRKIWFCFSDFFSADQRQLFYPVLFSPRQQSAQDPPVIFRIADHKGPVPAIFDVKIPAELLHPFRTFDVQDRFQAARFRIISGVDDPAVRFGLSHRCVVFFFQDHDAVLIFCQMIGDQSADDPAADNGDVIFIFAAHVVCRLLVFLLYFLQQKTRQKKGHGPFFNASQSPLHRVFRFAVLLCLILLRENPSPR